MAATITSVGNGTVLAASNTIDSGNLSVQDGDWLVMVIACDNPGLNGASVFDVFGDLGGGAGGLTDFTTQAHILYDPGSAGAGADLMIGTCRATSTSAVARVRGLFTANISEGGLEFYRVRPGAGEAVSFVAADGTGSVGAVTSHAAATVSVTSGDTIFGCAAIETDDAITGDSDTTNGNWSAIVTILADSGADAAAMSCSSQFKTVNATGNQAWACTTGTARDSARTYLVLRSAAAGTQFNQSVLGSSSPTGALVRQGGKPLQVTSSPLAALVRQTGKPVVVSSSPAVAVLRAVSKAIAAQASLAPAVTKQTSKRLATSSAPSPSLTVSRVVLLALQAVASPVASLVRRTGKVVAVAADVAGAIARAVSKRVHADAATSGAVTRQTGKIVGASSVPLAALTALRVVLLTIAATTAPVAALVRQTGKSVLAANAPLAALARLTSKALRVTTAPSASLSRTFTKIVQASASAAASVSKSTGKIMAAVTTPLASLVRRVGKGVAAIAGVAAGLARFIAKTLRANATVAALLDAVFAPGSSSVSIDPNYLVMAPPKVRGLRAGGNVHALIVSPAVRSATTDGYTRGLVMPAKERDL